MYISSNSQIAAQCPVIAEPLVTTLHEKGSGVINEDLVLAASPTFGVFDGATSLVEAVLQGGRTGGLRAAEISREIFSSNSLSLLEAAERANTRIREESVGCGVDQRLKESLWSVAAAVVRLEDDSFSWCRIGDCSIAVLYGDGSVRLLGDDFNHDGATLRKWKLLSRCLDGPIMEVMAEEIRDVRRRMNIDYGVLSGEKEALDFLQSGRLSLDGIESVLLFSDGLMLPQTDPDAPQDVYVLAELFRSGGLKALQNRVRRMQQFDIGCRIYPRFKTHDDIGAVALSFS